jgi:AcrR family transcriptional regulator
MELFWAKGYEGATLAELQRVMGGITAPSFYAAFGSKEALFREAVALYHQTQGAPIVKALAEGPTAPVCGLFLWRIPAASPTEGADPAGTQMPQSAETGRLPAEILLSVLRDDDPPKLSLSDSGQTLSTNMEDRPENRHPTAGRQD